MLFEVKWVIDIEAGTPQQAAQVARQIQLDPENTATFFNIRPHDSNLGPWLKVEIEK